MLDIFCPSREDFIEKLTSSINYVLKFKTWAEKGREDQVEINKLTNCNQGMFKKSAPANSRGDSPARLASLRNRQQLRVMAQALAVAKPLFSE